MSTTIREALVPDPLRLYEHLVQYQVVDHQMPTVLLIKSGSFL